MLIDARGLNCPIPVVKTKKAIRESSGEVTVETLVDNKTAVQNLLQMAKDEGLDAVAEQVDEDTYKVSIAVSGAVEKASAKNAKADDNVAKTSNIAVAISSTCMGVGDEKLGKQLMKSFIYTLTTLETKPSVVLFYNSGAYLTCEGSDSIDDIKTLENMGVKILTCGTCVNFYGIADTLKVGTVTNMYAIAEHMLNASSVVKP